MHALVGSGWVLLAAVMDADFSGRSAGTAFGSLVARSPASSVESRGCILLSGWVGRGASLDELGAALKARLGV